jgi:hypothetical protein
MMTPWIVCHAVADDWRFGDPCPLVILEAGARSVPTICFERSGAEPELVKDDAGLVGRYLDVKGFAACVRRLSDGEGCRRACGAAAAVRVHAQHSLDSHGPKLLRPIQTCSRRIGPVRRIVRFTETLASRSVAQSSNAAQESV